MFYGNGEMHGLMAKWVVPSGFPSKSDTLYYLCEIRNTLRKVSTWQPMKMLNWHQNEPISQTRSVSAATRPQFWFLAHGIQNLRYTARKCRVTLRRWP